MIQATLFNFEKVSKEATQIKTKQEEQAEYEKRVMGILAKKTAFELRSDLRENCHPNPTFEPFEDEDQREISWRSYYLRECEQRGLSLLNELGWPTEDDSLYCNIYTGQVSPLREILGSMDEFRVARGEGPDDLVWSVIEHDEPYDPKKPNVPLLKKCVKEIKRAKKGIEGVKRKDPQYLNGESPKSSLKWLKRDLAEYEAELNREKTRMEKEGIAFDFSSLEKCDKNCE